jgi:hypothetical protein
MSKKDPRKLAKKRRAEKKRLAERKMRQINSESQAYDGNKFRKAQFVPFIMATEMGIHEADKMSHGKMTDHDAGRALGRLIHDIRCGSISVGEMATDKIIYESNDGLAIDLIRSQWVRYLREDSSLGRDSYIGCLRTILGSIETWGNANPASRGYLRYLEGFMDKLGVHVMVGPADDDTDEEYDDLPDEDSDADDISEGEEDDGESEESDEEVLLEAGYAWVEDNAPGAKEFFGTLAEEMMQSGQAFTVAEICREIASESRDPRITEALIQISLYAQHKARKRKGLLSFVGSMFGR